MGMVGLIKPKPVLPRERQLFSNTALRAMIVPLVIEQVLQMIVGIVDKLMVSYIHIWGSVMAVAGDLFLSFRRESMFA